jgi:flagellar L-ring protein precursor FlgH
MKSVIAIAAGAVICAPALGQSLFLQQPEFVGDAPPDVPPGLAYNSMFFVQPPQPRKFAAHDIVHVIINETSSANSSQTLETTKDVQIQNTLNGIVDPRLLLELQLRAADTANLTIADLQAQNTYSGDGSYDRSDRLSARIAAEIVDVKPNGTLILRARKTVGTDEETRTITLTGTARTEDVTDENTVLSSQLADLVVAVENDGEVRKAAKKGIITKAIEFLFNF